MSRGMRCLVWPVHGKEGRERGRWEASKSWVLVSLQVQSLEFILPALLSLAGGLSDGEEEGMRCREWIKGMD